MAEICDAACVKNIINTRLVAYIARHLADVCGAVGSPLANPAHALASASRATCEAYAVAIEEGTLSVDNADTDWHGCDDAAFLIKLAQSIRDHAYGYDQAAARAKIDALTDKANATTLRLVSVKAA